MSPRPIHLNLRAFLHHLLSFLSPMENPKDNPNPNPNPNPKHNYPLPQDEQYHQPEHEVEEEGEEDDEEDGVGTEVEAEASEVHQRAAAPPRMRFTDLSQVDADLALARTLQEQERAYMMLSMGVTDVGEYRGAETESEYEFGYGDGEGEGEGHDFQAEEHGSVEGSDYDDEDAFDVQEHDAEIDPSAYNDDEAYARALQEAEERDVAVRLMALAGINDWVADDREDHGSNSQDTWQDVDPDDFSYEELVALGEAVGTESRGLSTDMIATLPSVSYKAENTQDENNDQCVICRLDYENGDLLSVLPCKHNYHSECINKWLQINKKKGKDGWRWMKVKMFVFNPLYLGTKVIGLPR